MASRSNKPYHVKNYNLSNNNRHLLQPGDKGFFCTFSYGEKDCKKEAINLLREYCEVEKDKPVVTNSVEEATDIMDSLDNELQSLSKKDNIDWKKFTPLSTLVKHCIFISTTVEDPCELMYKILEDLEKTQVQKTKCLLRMLPISVTCKANIPSIVLACTDLFAREFSTEPTTFAIAFNHRYNNSVKRDEVIKELANKVASFGEHTVDLSGRAKKTIIVEILKSVCCLSVVKNYGRFCKFNLLSVCGQPEKQTAEGETGEIEKSGSSSLELQKQEKNDQENFKEAEIKQNESAN